MQPVLQDDLHEGLCLHGVDNAGRGIRGDLQDVESRQDLFKDGSMNVLILATHINIGGIGFYIFNLAKGLKAKGINCVVASSGGGLEERFKENGIPLLKLNIKTKCEFHPKLIIAIPKLIKFVNDNGIDIIHAHTRVAQVMGNIISKFSKAAFVTTCHGFFKSERISRRLFPLWGDGTIAISRAVKAHLVNDFRLPEGKIALIYNGIDTDVCLNDSQQGKESLKKSLGLGDGPVIGAVGRLSPVKGYKYLLLAMKDIKKDLPQANLLIVGEGPSENKLKDLSRNLNLGESVKFIKSTLEVKKFLDVMDIFVSPSLQEGLGLSLIEAMACGKACIATSIGGISEIIEDAYNGLLVPPSDSHALKDAIKKLISDKGLFSKLKNNARDSVKDKFSLERMADETIKFYEDVLK